MIEVKKVAQKGSRMISAASQRIMGLSGHSKFIKAMTPTFMPEALVEEALKRGCAMCDSDDLQKLADAAKNTKQEDMTRREKLVAAIDDMVVENNPVRFGGTGLPKVSELEKQAGFKVKQEERDLAWKEWNDKNKAAQLDTADEENDSEDGSTE